MNNQSEEIDNILRWVVKIALIAMGIGLIVSGCSYLNEKAGLPDDNFLEEIIEQHIEEQTGFEIDLTPYTVET